MVSLTRLVNWIALIAGMFLFLMFQGEVDLIQRIAGGTVLLALASLIIFTGRERIVVTNQIEQESAEEIPEPITLREINLSGESESEDEQVMTRSRGRATLPVMMPPPTLPVMMPPPTLPVMTTPPQIPNQQGETGNVIPPKPIPDGANVAMKYVAKGDAVSDEEEEIEGFIAQRRERRDELLSEIERRRRMKLAERKASMTRKWSEAEDGEDLALLLRGDEHGIQVFEEPENPDTGKPLGITYFRIDENRVLMMRTPLEIPKKKPIIDEKEVSQDLSFPPGMPPLPPPGMPPLPPSPNPNES